MKWIYISVIPIFLPKTVIQKHYSQRVMAYMIHELEQGHKASDVKAWPKDVFHWPSKGHLPASSEKLDFSCPVYHKHQKGKHFPSLKAIHQGSKNLEATKIRVAGVKKEVHIVCNTTKECVKLTFILVEVYTSHLTQ